MPRLSGRLEEAAVVGRRQIDDSPGSRGPLLLVGRVGRRPDRRSTVLQSPPFGTERLKNGRRMRHRIEPLMREHRAMHRVPSPPFRFAAHPLRQVRRPPRAAPSSPPRRRFPSRGVFTSSHHGGVAVERRLEEARDERKAPFDTLTLTGPSSSPTIAGASWRTTPRRSPPPRCRRSRRRSTRAGSRRPGGRASRRAGRARAAAAAARACSDTVSAWMRAKSSGVSFRRAVILAQQVDDPLRAIRLRALERRSCG